MRIITLPGIGGSDAEHWQTIWERESPELRRFAPSSWDEPDLEDWSAAVDLAVSDEPAVLVAHSLACLLAVRWSAANPGRLAGLFIVAAPDPSGPSFPRQAASFASDLDARPSIPALLVTSDDDPYCSESQSARFAAAWQIPRISVGRRGHLNSASGLGSWSEGRNLLTAFTAGLR
jgi:uncharacterized protein